VLTLEPSIIFIVEILESPKHEPEQKVAQAFQAVSCMEAHSFYPKFPYLLP
jgi:hypothetical protein